MEETNLRFRCVKDGPGCVAVFLQVERAPQIHESPCERFAFLRLWRLARVFEMQLFPLKWVPRAPVRLAVASAFTLAWNDRRRGEKGAAPVC